MSTRNDVTIIYRQQLLTDLALLNHAREMLRRASRYDSNKVLAVAIVELERRLAGHIHALDGLAAVW